MNNDTFLIMCKSYERIIEKMIIDNVRFFRCSETIKWSFAYNENISIVASCNRKSNVVYLNVCAVDYAYTHNEMETIEYFLLHEIRHFFQHVIISDYKNGRDICIGKELVEQWIYEEDNYIPAIDRNNNENPGYFNQDIEKDAYAYSYAVMKYKYHDTSKLNVPNVYGEEFYRIVDDWIKIFEMEHL